jgi:hypothetical protein
MAKPINSSKIEGAWQMNSYVRKDGKAPLTGVLLLTSGRWSTLYFVPQNGVSSTWCSAEAGRYTVKGDELTFRHDYTFQGGGGKELVMDLTATTVETCRIVLTSETLEISFPSGNVIHCCRYPE